MRFRHGRDGRETLTKGQKSIGADVSERKGEDSTGLAQSQQAPQISGQNNSSDNNCGSLADSDSTIMNVTA